MLWRNFLTLIVAGAVLAGCQQPGAKPPAGKGGEHAIHRLEEVTDRAQVEALAERIIPGAKPIPGYVGLVGLAAEGLQGAVLAPEGWAKAAKPESADMEILVFSVSDAEKRFKDPFVTKLKEAVSARNGHAPTKAQMYSPFVLKVGGYEYLCQKAETMTANGMKGVEYWVTLPQDDGQTVYVVASGLPGFVGYFPDQKLTEFLKQLPKPVEKPATPAATQ